MALKQVEVTGLFGRFDYNIPLKTQDNITIVTAPNGFGKTVILRLITHFFKRQFAHIRRYDFDTLSFLFTDNRKIVVHNQNGRDLFGDAERARDTPLTFEPVNFDSDAQLWSFQISEETLLRRAAPERYLPYVTRVGVAQWTDDRTGKSYSVAEILDLLPPSVVDEVMRNAKIPKWLSSSLREMTCHLIETQRLLLLDEEPEGRVYGRAQRTLTTVVQTNAKHLAARIGSTLQSYANEAQKLDQSFPKRVLNHLTKDPPTEEQVRNGLASLEEERTRLANVGLLDKSFGEQITYYDRLDDRNIRNILAAYIDDTTQKLRLFDDLYKKIYAFQNIINSHFFFKKMTTSAKGMTITGDRGDAIPLDALSSGEQHELVLIYELLFKVPDNALILIDEPELSLHVAWQKRFIADLQEIQTLRPLAILIATHSPQIINERLDLMVELDREGAHNVHSA